MVLVKLTYSDRHEASRGLFATEELGLLVCFVSFLLWFRYAGSD